eukprot:scaffold1421_cov255-Pinguiococcus_pyrenoidosus.AAC.7
MTPWSLLRMVAAADDVPARTRLLWASLAGTCASFSAANLRAMLLNVNLPGDREVGRQFQSPRRVQIHETHSLNAMLDAGHHRSSEPH